MARLIFLLHAPKADCRCGVVGAAYLMGMYEYLMGMNIL